MNKEFEEKARLHAMNYTNSNMTFQEAASMLLEEKIKVMHSVVKDKKQWEGVIFHRAPVNKPLIQVVGKGKKRRFIRTKSVSRPDIDTEVM